MIPEKQYLTPRDISTFTVYCSNFMANVNFHQVFKMFVKYLVLRIYKYLVVLSSGRDGVGLVSCVSIYTYITVYL